MTSGHVTAGPVMWGAIGIAFLVLAVVAVHPLDSRIAAYAVGALFLVCLTVCGAAFWLDSAPHEPPAGLEHTSCSIDGQPGSYTLRATQVYRLEDGEWMVALRHGDIVSE